MGLEVTSDNNNQFYYDNAVFIEARELVIDYASATGGLMPNYENLEALYYNGMLSHHPEEIVRACQCETVEDFQELMLPWYEDDARSLQTERREILAEIEAKRAKGRVPNALFKIIEKSDRVSYFISGKEATDEDKITRYARWEVLQDFKQDPASGNVLGEKTQLEIVLGVSISSGKKLSPFPSGLIVRRGDKITKGQIEAKATDLGYLDYVYPELRSKLLVSVLEAAEPIYLPDHMPEAYRYAPPELFVDTSNKKILGKLALEIVMSDDPTKGEKVRRLGEFLLDARSNPGSAEHIPYKYNRWTIEDFTNYGKWILKVIEPYGQIVTARVLSRASKLDLGPNDEVLSRVFGSLLHFYKESGLTTKNAKGLFDHWRLEDFADYVRHVASLNGGEISTSILQNYYEANPNWPSPRLIKGRFGNIGTVFRAADLGYHKTYTHEECLRAGLIFTEENEGKVPGRKDFEHSSILPTYHPIYRLFGSIPNFQQAIREAIASRLIEVGDHSPKELVA